MKTVYFKVFPAEVTDYTPIADAVAASNAQIVLLGSVDVPTVSAFIHAFAQQHYDPQAFIATAGPDQGAAFVSAVGAGNTDGMMVPDAWYGGSSNNLSKAMVAAYIKKYGGTPSDINADVAEAFSVGEVTTQAVEATHSLDGSKLISYLHGNVTVQSVQGPVHFDNLGENVSATIFVFQWVHGSFVPGAPPRRPRIHEGPVPEGRLGKLSRFGDVGARRRRQRDPHRRCLCADGGRAHPHLRRNGHHQRGAGDPRRPWRLPELRHYRSTWESTCSSAWSSPCPRCSSSACSSNGRS